MVACYGVAYRGFMEIAPALAQEQGDEVRQALLLKRAIKMEQATQLALIESVQISGTNQPAESGLVGRLLNEQA